MDEFLGIGTLRVHASANEQIKGKLGIQNRALGDVAKIARPVMPGSEVRPARLVQPRHGGRRDVFVELPMEEARHARIKADISIVNFTGERIYPGRTLRKSGVGVAGKPAQRAVSHVCWIPIHVVRLLFDLNGILESDSLESLIPEQYAFADRVAVFHRNCVFQPEHDGLLWARERCRRILLFEMPAVNISPARFETRGARAVVLYLREEVADAVIREARTIARLWQFRNAVTKMELHAPHVRNVARRRRRRRRRRWRGCSGRKQRGNRRMFRGVMGYSLDLHILFKRL